ncbi:MAG: ABC transporter substrate-binding protein [Deltaproteobacteria bacterium]|nr:ABC transporter substrate-binding protein [Deltaproteobacteria bacterium]MBI3078780.1 ABC transporter substrate-binding protein [Deltaproteobacteria bacterium]
MRRRGSDMIAIALVGLALLAGLGSRPAGAQDRISFALDWIAYGKHAMFYVPVERGLYSEQGLQVTVLRGYGSGDTVKRVAAGTELFGFADTGALVVARSRGVKVKTLAMIHDKGMHSLITLKGSGITKPKDLEGRALGGSVGGAIETIFPAFAALNGVDASKVKWIWMDAAAIIPSLMAGRIDAGVGFATEHPTARAAAAKAGKEISAVFYGDWGLDIYSNGIVAQDRTVQERPDLVRRFVQATMRGVAWTVEHPDEATDIFVKHHPAVSRDLARAHLGIAIDHLLTPVALSQGIGFMTREKMDKTVEIIARYMKLPSRPPTEELYSNEFLPKLFPKRR